MCLFLRASELVAQEQLQSSKDSPEVTVSIGDAKCGGIAITSLIYNGVQWADPNQSYCIEFVGAYDANNNSVSLGSNTGSNLDTKTNTWTWTFEKGSVSLHFKPNGSDLDIEASVTNNSGTDIAWTNMWLSDVTTPDVSSLPLPTSQSNDYPLVYEYDTSKGNMYLTGIGIVTGSCWESSGGWCLIAGYGGPVPNGTTKVSDFSIRFRPVGTALTDVLEDVFKQWTKSYPFIADKVWPDRRPIATWFLGQSPFICYVNPTCNSTEDWSTNLNGWFTDPTVDVTTPSGLQAWAERMLGTADTNIQEMKLANAQGVIIWDLEGDKWPQCTTYIGDPRNAENPLLAPEWDTQVTYDGKTMNVIDAVFKKLKDAGFKTGVTIRPDQLDWTEGPDQGCGGGGDYGPLGIRPSQVYATDDASRIALLESKISFAYNRWGVTIFYIDSDDWIAGQDIIKIHHDFPDVLLMPENTTVLEYSVGIPFNYTKFSGAYSGPGIFPYIGAIYPKAAAALNSSTDKGNELVVHHWELVNAIRHGSLILYDSWFPNGDVKYINNIYAEAKKPVVAPKVSASGATSITASEATFNGKVSATGGSVIYSRGFEYGGTTSYGKTITLSGTFDSNVDNPDAEFSAIASGLRCGKTYHYRAFATNFDGSNGAYTNKTGTSKDKTFKTGACPAPTRR